jgi:hypothetical protein
MSQDQFETMKYFMAAEKIGNLLFQIEICLEFLEEYSISPDENVRTALIPKINKLKEWLG